MHSDCDGIELPNGVGEQVLVLCRANARVALNETLCEVVDEESEGMISGFESLRINKQ